MKTINIRNNSGFTLLELMIVISIIAALMLVIAPLGRGWVASSHVNSAVNNLHHATLLAKSSALRNKNNIRMGEVAVSVCFYSSANILQVIHGDCPNAPIEADDNSDDIVQSYSMAKNIAISVGGESFTCLSYDSAGVLANTADCVANTKDFLVFKEVAGDVLDEATIDVI